MVKYAIADKNGRYLKSNHSGSFVNTSSHSLADTWTSMSKAKNVLNSCINKNLRKKYHIVELEDPEVTQFRTDDSGQLAQVIKDDKSDSRDYWVEKLKDMDSIIEEAEVHKTKLLERLSKEDQAISDIYHYIEFGKFNAYQGWQAFDMLRSRLKHRRTIKNELDVIQAVQNCSANRNSVQATIEKIDAVEQKKYTPRVLMELF